MAPTDAEQLLLQATGRTELVDALEWIAEARALPKAPATHLLLQALTTLADSGEHAELAGQALKQYARPALRSRLDPSTELLLVDTLTMPASYKESLEEVARHTKSRTLKDITPTAIRAAQDANEHVLETLCAVAGLSFRDLRDRVGTTRLPTSPRRTWTQAQVEGAFAVIDAVVRGTVTASSPAAAAARPVEFVLAEPGTSGGWDAVEAMRTGGVTYEVLLAQRVVGSAWGAHRNATGSKVQESVRAKLETLLDERNVPHEELRRDRRSRELLRTLGLTDDADAETAEGGDSSNAGQVAFIIGKPGAWRLAVTVSVARDGGTANKSGGKLLTLPRTLAVPLAAVLVGPGWADRNETVELVRALGGRVFSDATLTGLADLAAAATVVVPISDDLSISATGPATTAQENQQ